MFFRHFSCISFAFLQARRAGMLFRTQTQGSRCKLPAVNNSRRRSVGLIGPEWWKHICLKRYHMAMFPAVESNQADVGVERSERADR